METNREALRREFIDLLAVWRIMTPDFRPIGEDEVAAAVQRKLRYAHQGGMNPPVIVVHGNALQHITDSYTRYLTQTFRKAFNLQGTPLRIQYNVSENPYEEAEDKPKKKPLRRVALSNRIEKRENRKEDKERFKKKRKVSVKKMQK